jgi:hypothetical protein
MMINRIFFAIAAVEIAAGAVLLTAFILSQAI